MSSITEKSPASVVSVSPDVILESLRRIRSKGLVRLAHIDPKTKAAPSCTTFDVQKDEQAIVAYVERWNAGEKHGIYYEAGVPRGRMNKKSAATDISHVTHHIVDLDPLPGEMPADAKKRIYNLIEEAVKAGKVPQPTLTYESGGGVVAKWQRRTALRLDTAEAVAHATSMNAAIRDALGGKKSHGADDCISPDHLFRLPGTINYPSEKKKHRGVQMSGNLQWHGRKYDESDLPTPARRIDCVQIDFGDAVAIEPRQLPKDLRALYDHGCLDNREPATDNSGSGWRMKFIYLCLRQGYVPAQVLSLLMDPHNNVSAPRVERASSNNSARSLFEREIQKAADKLNSDRSDQLKKEFAGVDAMPEYADTSKPAIKTKKNKENRPRFKAYRYSEISNSPAQRYLLQGLIPVNSVFCLFGNENAGKTFWALSFGLCVASGIDFHGVETRRGKVIHVIGEGSVKAFSYRVAAWIKRTAATRDDVTEFELKARIEANWSVVPMPVTINSGHEVSDFLKDNNPEGPRALVILDTLLRNFEGDINAPKDMMGFVRGVDAIKNKTGAAVLILHHPGLKEVGRPAGSRALAGAVDGMARLFDDNGRRVFKLVKLRDGAVDQKPLVYVLETVEVDFDFDREGDHESAYLAPVDIPSATVADSILQQLYVRAPRSQTDVVVPGVRTKSAKQRVFAKLRRAGYIGEGLTLTAKGKQRAHDLFPDDGVCDEDSTLD